MIVKSAMPHEILINKTSRETRVAWIENEILTDIYIEKQQRQSLVGHIYRGRIIRVVPSIQAAFIDIGLERAGFLHIKDVCLTESIKSPEIQTILRTGQYLLVQVAKDVRDSKGPRLTTFLNIPARFLVLTPYVDQVIISQKIQAKNEIERLKEMIKPGQWGGYIIRTAAENVSLDLLQKEKEFLDGVWEAILVRSTTAQCHEILYAEMPIELRLLRDGISNHETRVLIDHHESFCRMREYLNTYLPAFADRLIFYEDKMPIFDLYEIEKELQKALYRTIYLKSGGYVVFDQTEAMTTIDVNTGTSIGHKSPAETILQVNLEAAKMIAQQIRLRNLGGIIIIDFIDMDDVLHREKILLTLKQYCIDDKVRTEFSEVTRLGLVQMTRKRTHKSLEKILCEPCPTCHCRGSIKSIETIACDLSRSVQRKSNSHTWSALRIQAAPDIIDYLQKDGQDILQALEINAGRRVELVADSRYAREQYDILPAADGKL